MQTAKKTILAALIVVGAVGLTACGESLNNVQTADLSQKQPSAVAGPALQGEALSAAAAGKRNGIKSPGAGGEPASFGIAGGPAETSGGGVSGKSATDAFIAVSTPGNTAYKIGPEDVVDISVFKVPELSKSAQVADGGTINLPLVGEIQAAGKTARDLEVELTKKLGVKYLRNPQVSVTVKEYNSQRVTVEGAVKKPGVYPIRGKSSLLQTIANAGGLEELADQGSLIVVRQVDGKRYAGRFDLDSIRKGAVADPALQQGDVVIVNTSDTKQALQTFLKIIPVANVFALL